MFNEGDQKETNEKPRKLRKSGLGVNGGFQDERFVKDSSVNGASSFFFQILEEIFANELKDNDPNEAVDHLFRFGGGQCYMQIFNGLNIKHAFKDPHG